MCEVRPDDLYHSTRAAVPKVPSGTHVMTSIGQWLGYPHMTTTAFCILGHYLFEVLDVSWLPLQHTLLVFPSF